MVLKEWIWWLVVTAVAKVVPSFSIDHPPTHAYITHTATVEGECET